MALQIVFQYLYILLGILCSCLLSGCGQTEGQRSLQQHQAWFESEWSAAECKVLSAGVAINNRNWDLGPEQDEAQGFVPTAIQPSTTFFSTAGAVCPGAYKCADEKGTCMCFGIVTYAPDSMVKDGSGVLSFASDRLEKVQGFGSIVCSHEASIGGAFSFNPAPSNQPWDAKSCWCSPTNIMQESEVDSGISDCVSKADADWKALAGRATPSATMASLTGTMSAHRISAPSAASNRSFNSFSARGNTQERRLLNTRRRRRTLEYAPWALVKVSSGFSETKVRCAFEYGVARASYDNYETDAFEPGSADPKGPTLMKVVSSWVEAGDQLPCWVRQGGESGRDQCAVALKKHVTTLPTDLIDISDKGQTIAYIFMFSIVLVFFLMATVRKALHGPTAPITHRVDDEPAVQTLPYSLLEG